MPYGYQPFPTSIGRTKLTPIPMINVKLPTRHIGMEVVKTNDKEPSLSGMLSQFGLFLEEGGYVPKNKTVIYSDNVCFVHVQRREPLPNFTGTAIDYPSFPRAFVQMKSSRINTTSIDVPETLNINSQKFNLRSVVVVDPPQVKDQVSTTSSTLVIKPTEAFGFESNDFIYYNPMAPANAFTRDSDNAVVHNNPFTNIPYYDDDTNIPSFCHLAKKYGSIYIYVNPDIEDNRNVVAMM
jgi:hypothetical protein